MRLVCKSDRFLQKKFQSTHPRGVRPIHYKQVDRLFCFNPRTHVGCDTLINQNIFNIRGFQSTHPRGVRQKMTRLLVYFVLFQSTHPRGVRRLLTGITSCSQVSIHAPTWGATNHWQEDLQLRLFQSTHPRGVRHVVACDIGQQHTVSIHAPTWGATVDGCRHCRCSISFNPRTHVGCDYIHCSYYYILICFNPRTHVGCDDQCLRLIKDKEVSIHAPTWGATYLSYF